MNAPPINIRDIHGGVYRPSAISNVLAPPHTVAHAMNVNFEQIIGSGVVRKGIVRLGTPVASGRTPLGYSEFVGPGGSPNYLVAVYAGASNASIYYFDGVWHTSGATSLNNSAKNRFATLGGRIFRVSSGNAMTSSADAITWATTNCITTDSVIPTIIIRSKNHLLASGYSGYRNRVYFSSVIDPAASPTLSWNTDSSTGDWIDINPDDGDYNTGFAETSAITLVFKNYAMYRLNTITKTTDPDLIYNVGAPSQEAITQCEGVTYFFSGVDIRRTVGDFPQQISRLGVQDFIDAIPQSYWSSVALGNDGFSVYASIGDVTLDAGEDTQVTYKRVVLKFSPRDESWSIHSYSDAFLFFANYTTTAGRTMTGAAVSSAFTLNSGLTDNGNPIFYELITQDQDFGNRAHKHVLSDKLVVYAQFGLDGKMEVITDEDVIPLDMNLEKRVNVTDNISVRCHFCAFRWYGESTGQAPIFEGVYCETITDEGIK